MWSLIVSVIALLTADAPVIITRSPRLTIFVFNAVSIAYSNNSSVEFLGSANDNRGSNNNPQFDENPFDSMEPPIETTSVDNDPFASFGEKVEISDNELPF